MSDLMMRRQTTNGRPCRSSRSGAAVLVSVLIVLLGVSVLAARPEIASGAGRRPLVIVYGDSLTAESRNEIAFFTAVDGDVRVIVRGVSGTAPCDHFGQMGRDRSRLRPDLVLVAFSGNDLTPCIQNRSGSTGEKYAAAVGQIARLWGATPVGFVLAPKVWTTQYDGVRSVVDKRAAATGLPVVDTNPWFSDPSGAAVDRMACFPWEPCGPTGEIAVRNADGVHLCGSGYVERQGLLGLVAPQCVDYSSGALRYGMAIGGFARTLLELG
jgi:GDSL-like Lipase/Acylhydrolase family